MPLQLGTERFLTIPELPLETDPNKLRKVYGGSHDIRTNRNGKFYNQSFFILKSDMYRWKL